MPKYDLEDWVTWKRIVGTKSKVCSECGQMVYRNNPQKEVTGKIMSVETFKDYDGTHISYNIRLDLEEEVILVSVPEDWIIEKEY